MFNLANPYYMIEIFRKLTYRRAHILIFRNNSDRNISMLKIFKIGGGPLYGNYIL